MNINLYGELGELEQGIEVILEELGFESKEEGLSIRVEKGDRLEVYYNELNGKIIYKERVEFFRGLGLLRQAIKDEKKIEMIENKCFTTNGVMFDVSRNAVLNMDTIKYFLRKMALMGLNVGMMYTEETYKIEGEKFFGYMRGSYTVEELREIDEYAYNLGIELIPCIQTLAHLERALHWDEMSKYRDTQNVLLVGSEEVYELIEKMIQTTCKTYRSKKIHLGMDEAMDLGLGRYLKQNGYKRGFDLIQEHLKRINEIMIKYDLEPMMWSDMYFRLASKSHNYYDLASEVPEQIINQAPENIGLVYWDYYHKDYEFYVEYIKRHQKFKAKTLFAGGIWSWLGPVVNYTTFFNTSMPALQACKDQGVQDVLLTAWGDNGAECNLLAILFGMQVYAEFGYKGEMNIEEVKERFENCVGAEAKAFLEIDEFDHPIDLLSTQNRTANPSKCLLYQDPLMGLFDKDIKDLNMRQHYKGLAEKYDKYAANNSEFGLLFGFYHQLARVLERKSEIGIDIHKSYMEKEKLDLEKIGSQEIPILIEEMKRLKECWRDLWLSTYKPFGFEVIDIRLGGVIARLEYTQFRLKQYTDGKLDRIEELEEEQLNLLRNTENALVSCGRWSAIVSAANI